MVYRAVGVPAEVGVLEGMLMGNVYLIIGDKNCEAVSGVRIGAEKRGK